MNELAWFSLGLIVGGSFVHWMIKAGMNEIIRRCLDEGGFFRVGKRRFTITEIK